MALRLGKKKDADTTVVTEPDGTTTVVTDTTTTRTMPSEDQFADLIPDNLPPKKRGPSAAVVGGAALALVIASAGAWWMFGRESVEEVDDVSTPSTMRVATAPDAPDAPAAPKAPGAPAEPGAPAKTTTVVKKVEVAGDRPMSRPEKAGIVPPQAAPGSPVIAAAQAESVPRFVPVPNAPTPVPLIRPGMAGQPGRRADRRQVVVVSPGFSATSPAFQAQLKLLWNNGAAAKQRGDYAAARSSWQRILELDPGHAGIQEAIDKLPA